MTTTPQAALLSEAIKLANEFRVTMPREVLAIWGADVQAELRRLDALVAHLTADRDDTANELALRTKHNLALTNERDQLLAKLQATQEPAQAGGLPTPFGYVSDGFQDGLHFQHKPWPEMHMLLNSVAQVYSAAQMRAALSARKPLLYDLICNAIDLADTESMNGDYMLESGDCIAVVRTMQALIEINGIGLEVKP